MGRRRKRRDKTGDKQLKKHKNRDKKHKWKHKNVLTRRPFCRLQPKGRFYIFFATIVSWGLERDGHDYVPGKFLGPDESTATSKNTAPLNA